jgi:hypothetical protein
MTIEINWVSDQGVRTCWLCLHFCQSIVFESRISFFIVMAPKRRSARKGSKKAAKKGGARGGDGFVGLLLVLDGVSAHIHIGDRFSRIWDCCVREM